VAAAVDVFVKDDSAVPAPVAGVDVSIFDANSLAFITSSVTDQDGRAAFLLPGSALPGTPYEVRSYKMGDVFTNPARIYVIEGDPAAVNRFDMPCTRVGVFGIPIDPRVCRCAGRFLDFSNRPLVNTLVRVVAAAELKDRTPVVVDGNLISAEAMEFHTDHNGFLVIDLIRTGVYYIIFAGESDVVWNLRVPDRASANLIDLVHPYPVSMAFPNHPGNAVSVAVGAELAVPVEVTFSDYRTSSTDLGNYIEFMNSDSSVVSATLRPNGELVLVGVAPGVAGFVATLNPVLFPARVPSAFLSSPVLQVTVTAP
jgi:hypothetical protein